MIKVTKLNLKKKSSFIQNKNKFSNDCLDDLTKNYYGSNILLFIIIIIFLYFQQHSLFR